MGITIHSSYPDDTEKKIASSAYEGGIDAYFAFRARMEGKTIKVSPQPPVGDYKMIGRVVQISNEHGHGFHIVEPMQPGENPEDIAREATDAHERVPITSTSVAPDGIHYELYKPTT